MADKYDPIRLVGKGSFGSVYLVSRRRDGAQFVLKNMQIKNVPEKEIESYQNEVALLTALEHPGIVSHIESFIDGDRQHMCIVMGYCEGGDLAAYLKHKKGVPMRDGEVLYHFVQMAMALLFMHDKKILHRDLKTANIFLKDGLIQLGDFGISKALTGSNDFAQTCIGTPYYMSPELFQNKPYDYKSDVWALGCVLYEMMTYKHAFDATSINGLAQKILKGHIQQLPATYPKLMRTLVKDMLQLEPKSRPTIQQILSLPFLRKHIKTYVTAVIMNRAHYRTQDLNNFRAQINKLGMADMLEPPPQPPPTAPSVPPLALGQAQSASSASGSSSAANEKPSARASSRVPSSSQQSSDGSKLPPPSSSSSSAAAVAAREKEREKAAVAAARHREQAARLQALQEEEMARKSLEEKLSKLKKAHELKQKSLLDQQKRARPTSALPSARGSAGGVAPSAKAKPLVPSSSKSTLSKKPASSSSSSSSSSSAAAAAAAGSAGAKRPPSAGGVPSLPISSAHSVAAAGLPSQRGGGSSVPPSSSPPQSSNGHGVESRSSSRSQLAQERARKLSRERAEHEQALRLKEVEEMRAAEAARLAEVERVELKRRQLELVRRQKQESEAAAVAAREKELERARAEELARQRKVYLAQVEAEKAELERIQLEKAWINKRLNDLAAAKPAPVAVSSRAPVSRARNLREDSDEGLSQKDRILREKEQRRAAQDAEEQAKLLQGRQEAFRDRLKVHNQSKGNLAPHLQSAMAPAFAAQPGAAAQLYRQDSTDYDEDFDMDAPGGAGSGSGACGNVSSEDDDAVAEELAVEAEAIEEAEGLLLGLTRRIQDLRTSIQVPTVLEDAQDHEYGDNDFDDDEQDDDGAEDESESEAEHDAVHQQQQKAAAAAATPVITQNMLDRMKALAKECAKLVGRAKFIDAFDYLKGAAATVTRDQKVADLTRILGPEKVKYWEKIDQLVFMEKSS